MAQKQEKTKVHTRRGKHKTGIVTMIIFLFFYSWYVKVPGVEEKPIKKGTFVLQNIGLLKKQ